MLQTEGYSLDTAQHSSPLISALKMLLFKLEFWATQFILLTCFPFPAEAPAPFEIKTHFLNMELMLIKMSGELKEFSQLQENSQFLFSGVWREN